MAGREKGAPSADGGPAEKGAGTNSDGSAAVAQVGKAHRFPPADLPPDQGWLKVGAPSTRNATWST
jgi:hypothetical protein